MLMLALMLPRLGTAQAHIRQPLRHKTENLSLDTCFVDTLVFTKVNYINEYGRTCDTGKPELPVMYYNYIIPYDKTDAQIELTNKIYSNFTTNFPLCPVQTPAALCIDCEAPEFCHPNPQVYSSSSAFPANQIVSVEQNFFDGNRILTIGVCPFEYYPVTGQLRLLTSFNLNIELVADTMQRNIVPVKRLRHSQEIYDRVLSRLVENKSQISAFRSQPVIVDEIGETPSGLPAFEYVIVTPSAYMPAFADFVTWKKQKGIDIGVVAIEDVLSHYSGDMIFESSEIYDDAGKLRQYLFEARNEGTLYALLAGDLPNFPIRYGKTCFKAGAKILRLL